MAENIYALLQQAWAVATTGGASIYGVDVGIVTNVQDPEQQGRVKVCLPRLPGKPEGDWARVAQPAAGAGRGFYWLPQVGDEVLVAFERGQANHPYVIGSLWNGKDKPMQDAYTDENTTAMIQTRSGHRIVLSDKDGEEKISIADQTGKRVVTFDVKAKKFLIEAKEGDVELHAEKKLVLSCEDLEIKASAAGKLTVGTGFEMKAQKASVQASSQLNLKGATVNLNPPSLDVGALAHALAPAPAGKSAKTTKGSGAAQPVSGGAGAGGGAGGNLASDVSPASAKSAAEPADKSAADEEKAAVAADEIDLQLVSVSGKPQKGLEVELTFSDGNKRAGKTADDGHFKLAGLTVKGKAKLDVPDVQVAPAAEPSAAGRLRFAQGGIDVEIGQASVVELPPRVRRGRMKGMHFDTGKTFLLPSAMVGIRQLVKLFKSFEGIVGLVTGHTDRQGRGGADASADPPAVEFNRLLSNERAAIIKAYLLDQADAWMPSYGTGRFRPWGVLEDQHMLGTVKPKGSDTPFLSPPQADGLLGPDTGAAYKKFQNSRLLPETGKPDRDTRLELVRAYMALDGTSLDGKAQVETHGCGLTHPTPETEGDPARSPQERAKAKPDQPVNRRVEVFLFEEKIDPAPKSPCPTKGCEEYDKWVAQKVLDVDLDQPPGALEVKVTGEDGSAISGAHVHASGALVLDAQTGDDGAPATGADGEPVDFKDLVPGSYKVVAEKDGFSAADVTVDVPAGGAASAKITLKALGPDIKIEEFEARVLFPMDENGDPKGEGEDPQKSPAPAAKEAATPTTSAVAAPLEGPKEAQEGRQIELKWKVDNPDFEKVQLDPGFIDPPLAKAGDPASGTKAVTPDPARKDAQGFVTFTLTAFPKAAGKKPQVAQLKIKLNPRPSTLKADIAIDATSALLFCDESPLSAQAVDAATVEKAAIWGHVPPGFKPDELKLLIYFHGWDGFVTAGAGGAEGGKRPAWSPGNAESLVFKNAPLKANPKLLAAGRKYLLDEAAKKFQQPLVLVPEDATSNAGTGASFSATGSGNLGPKPQLGAMVTDAEAHLQGKFGLKNTFAASKAPYLPATLSAPRRLFLSGHSGGGVPLSKSALSHLASATPTDLILLDCTYGAGDTEYVDYCKAKGKAGLGNGAKQSRLCAFYLTGLLSGNKQKYIDDRHAEEQKKHEKNPSHTPKADEEIAKEFPRALGSSTMHHAEEIILPGLKSAGFTVSALQTRKPAGGWPPEDVLHLNTGDLAVIEDALSSKGIVFVRTKGVIHDDHPNTYIEPVLKTAGRAAPPSTPAIKSLNVKPAGSATSVKAGAEDKTGPVVVEDGDTVLVSWTVEGDPGGLRLDPGGHDVKAATNDGSGSIELKVRRDDAADGLITFRLSLGPPPATATDALTAAPEKEPAAGSSATVLGIVPHNIPKRDPAAPAGSAFMADLDGHGLDAPGKIRDREAKAIEQLLKGNVPSFMQKFVTVAVSAAGHTGEVYVAPDFLCIGSDTDFVRFPMTPLGAQKVQDAFLTTFPTRKIADEIFKSAKKQLIHHSATEWNKGIPAQDVFDQKGGLMHKNKDYVESNKAIEKDRGSTALGDLLAGHKKDLILDPNVAKQEVVVGKDRDGKPVKALPVVIYGLLDPPHPWPRQDAGFHHPQSYEDYSHGIRLVSQQMTVDGKPAKLLDVLRDKELHGLVAGVFDPAFPLRYPGKPTALELTLIDFAGNPMAGKSVILEVDGASRTVTTDPKGVLREMIPEDFTEARLTVDGVTMALGIGQLKSMDDAAEEGISGVQGRLANLGYYGGAINGQLDDGTRQAVRAFRLANELADSEEVDQPLKDKLREKYGC